MDEIKDSDSLVLPLASSLMSVRVATVQPRKRQRLAEEAAKENAANTADAPGGAGES